MNGRNEMDPHLPGDLLHLLLAIHQVYTLAMKIRRLNEDLLAPQVVLHRVGYAGGHLRGPLAALLLLFIHCFDTKSRLLAPSRRGRRHRLAQ